MQPLQAAPAIPTSKTCKLLCHHFYSVVCFVLNKCWVNLAELLAIPVGILLAGQCSTRALQILDRFNSTSKIEVHSSVLFVLFECECTSQCGNQCVKECNWCRTMLLQGA